MDVGRVDLQQIALGIHLPLPARDLLATVIAARTASLSGLDRLAVDHRRSWLRLAPLGDAMTLTQNLVDPFPGPRSAPLAQMIVNVLPGGQIVRHHAPWNTAVQNIEAAIDDPAQSV